MEVSSGEDVKVSVFLFRGQCKRSNDDSVVAVASLAATTLNIEFGQ